MFWNAFRIFFYSISLDSNRFTLIAFPFKLCSLFKYISYPVFIQLCIHIFLLCNKNFQKLSKLFLKKNTNTPYTSKQPLMMAYEGSESTRNNFGKFIYQFQPETKTLIRKLERILNKLYRQNVFLLFNETCIGPEK